MARGMGLTMSQWDALDDHDRAYALALDLVEAEARAGQCHQCGGLASECQDYDNQHAYVVTERRCFRTRAIQEAQRKRTDHDGVLFVATLDPTRKKSATKKGGPSG